VFEALFVLFSTGFLLYVVVTVYYVIGIYNSLIGLRNDISKAWANIDVLLKQRNDEIPNLISTVKGYMEYESRVVEGVAKARSISLRAESVGEKAAYNELISGALKDLFAVVEDYPDLKANEGFLKLQKRITGLENEIADRREFYNDAVTIFNTRIETYPDKLVADGMRLKRRPLFRATEQERRNIKADFSKA
jgi:LemA protein